jgi:transposase InsO family protein
MAGEGVQLSTKLGMVFAGQLPGVPVSQLCAELGVSRQTFYKWKRRWDVEGPPGLLERSRRPLNSPGLIDAAVEDEIVRLRKQRRVDRGPQAIAYQLQRAGWPAPSAATIWRVLVRRGLIEPEPQKRPKAATRRFEWPHPNSAWQIDATLWALRSGHDAWIVDILDDHSRLITAAHACHTPTGAAAWESFCGAIERWGVPAHVMSDNGTCFTGRLHRREVAFERNLRGLGVRHICSTPAHPQTCGKLERFHQTLKRELRGKPRARTLAELQDQLDSYVEFYNRERPHGSLRGATPLERWLASAPAHPGPPIAGEPRVSRHRVSANGKLAWRGYKLYVGSHRAGRELLIVARDLELTILGPDGILRRLTVDPHRTYQP